MSNVLNGVLGALGGGLGVGGVTGGLIPPEALAGGIGPGLLSGGFGKDGQAIGAGILGGAGLGAAAAGSPDIMKLLSGYNIPQDLMTKLLPYLNKQS